jgi:DNA-binding MarR family transcriptional regulator
MSAAKAASPIFQRRQRRKDHYHTLDKTIIFAYPNLSDGAKMTYITLDSYDWPDDSGTSKGYVFPYQETLANVRGVSLRTVQDHLRELSDAGLIKVECITTKQGRRNIYWIEDASQEEFERYLETMAKPQVEGGDAKNCVMGHAENCVMGDAKNCAHKDNKEKDTNPEGQDKTSGQVESLSHDEPVTEEELPPDKVERVLTCFADIVNRDATKLERDHLLRLMATYGWWEVEQALNELLVQQDRQHVKNPTRYLAGVLENWTKEGPRNTDMVAHLARMAQGDL